MKTVDIVKENVPSDVLGASLIALAWIYNETCCPVVAPPRRNERTSGVDLVGDVLDKLWENKDLQQAFQKKSIVNCQKEQPQGKWEQRGNIKDHYWYKKDGNNIQKRLEDLKRILVECQLPSAVLFYIPKPPDWLVPWKPQSKELARYEEACKKNLPECIYTITCPIKDDKGKLHEGADAYLVLGETDEDRRIVAHGRVQRNGDGYCVKCLYCGKDAKLEINTLEEIAGTKKWPSNDIAVEINEEGKRQKLRERWTQVVGDTLSFNRIIFGAPGTGKSCLLNKLAENCFDADNMGRVTFHPEYTYFDFVGSYKPVMNGVKIKYKFVPGPFARMLKKARENGDKRFCLIVEEINRARVAAVFGDIFQLLDREENGESAYEIMPTLELFRYLMNDVKQKLQDEDIKPIRIPNNLYIWATMNSADQGVYPLDTAFKRRWSMGYLDINAGAKDDNIGWNTIRMGINDLLKPHVNEDKLLGYYFLKKEERDTEAHLVEALKGKVLMYLFDDAAKACRKSVFKEINGGRTYSDLRDHMSLETEGLGIFAGGAFEYISDDTWDKIRKGINKLLLEKGHVNEDKLMGYYFLKDEERDTEAHLEEALKGKVLMYLFDDAAKPCRKNVFKEIEGSRTYSGLRAELSLKKDGLGIFTGSEF